MSDIVKDMVDDVVDDVAKDMDVSPKSNKLKTFVKWVIRIAVLLIFAAFMFGQYKILFNDRLNKIEELIKENTKQIEELHKELHDNINEVNKKIGQVYVDGYHAFVEYNSFRNEQVKLILDNTDLPNKETLKRMLDLNSTEVERNFKSDFKIDQPSTEGKDAKHNPIPEKDK